MPGLDEALYLWIYHNTNSERNIDELLTVNYTKKLQTKANENIVDN